MKETAYTSTQALDYSIWNKKVFPVMQFAMRIGYISLEIRGEHNIPRKENLVYAANHSSWLALDGLFIAYAICQIVGEKEVPRAIIHDILLKLPFVGSFYHKCGAIPVSWVRDLNKLPNDIRSFGIFPEGGSGNSKPFWEAYRLKQWKRGFVRLAINRSAKIVPIAVQGFEELMPAAFTLNFLKPLFGTMVGYPLFPFPLPSRLEITFCEPVSLSHYSRDILNDTNALDRIAEEVRMTVQNTLNEETQNRPLAKFSKFISSFDRT